MYFSTSPVVHNSTLFTNHIHNIAECIIIYINHVTNSCNIESTVYNITDRKSAYRERDLYNAFIQLYHTTVNVSLFHRIILSITKHHCNVFLIIIILCYIHSGLNSIINMQNNNVTTQPNSNNCRR